MGLKSIYPPLAKSDWVNGDPNKLIAVTLHGLTGPIRVNGVSHNRSMGPFRDALNNAEVAEVLNHIRTSWGNNGQSISPKDVHRIRRQGIPSSLLTKDSFIESN